MPNPSLGAISFTLEELCRAVDLRMTTISALDKMELLSRVLRVGIGCAVKREMSQLLRWP